MKDILDKQYKLSEEFSKEVNSRKTYKERMSFYDEYFKRWYSFVNTNKKEYADENFDLKIFNFILPDKNKTIYLHSPSLSEISEFSKRFKTVFFSSIPSIKEVLPKNCTQLYYDSEYIVDVSESVVNSIDIAFSHHVIEHIHSEDIVDHFKFINKLLKVGGEYYAVAPSKSMILRDSFGDKENKLAANHHIGRFSYSDIYSYSKEAHFSRVERPVLNPRLVNYWHAYVNQKADRSEDLVKIPKFFGSLLCVNSLYVRLVK